MRSETARTPLGGLRLVSQPRRHQPPWSEQLGLPQFDWKTTKLIEDSTVALADTVRDIVIKQGEIWPGLPDALRFDITLSGNGQNSWTPRWTKRGWGTFDSVPWIRVTVEGATGTVQSTELTDNLFGRHLVVHFSRGRITIDVDEHPNVDLRTLLALLIWGGVKSVGFDQPGRLIPGSVSTLPAPLTPDVLVALHDSDVTAANLVIKKYRDLRATIDRTVAVALQGAL